jgi:hypothetical protein
MTLMTSGLYNERPGHICLPYSSEQLRLKANSVSTSNHMRRCIKRSRTSLANGKLLTAAGETFHQTLCQDGWAEFLNAGSVISTDGVDGLHLEPICDYHTFGKLFCVIFGAIF